MEDVFASTLLDISKRTQEALTLSQESAVQESVSLNNKMQNIDVANSIQDSIVKIKQDALDLEAMRTGTVQHKLDQLYPTYHEDLFKIEQNQATARDKVSQLQKAAEEARANMGFGDILAMAVGTPTSADIADQKLQAARQEYNDIDTMSDDMVKERNSALAQLDKESFSLPAIREGKLVLEKALVNAQGDVSKLENESKRISLQDQVNAIADKVNAQELKIITEHYDIQQKSANTELLKEQRLTAIATRKLTAAQTAATKSAAATAALENNFNTKLKAATTLGEFGEANNVPDLMLNLSSEFVAVADSSQVLQIAQVNLTDAISSGRSDSEIAKLRKQVNEAMTKHAENNARYSAASTQVTQGITKSQLAKERASTLEQNLALENYNNLATDLGTRKYTTYESMMGDVAKSNQAKLLKEVSTNYVAGSPHKVIHASGAANFLEEVAKLNETVGPEATYKILGEQGSRVLQQITAAKAELVKGLMSPTKAAVENTLAIEVQRSNLNLLNPDMRNTQLEKTLKLSASDFEKFANIPRAQAVAKAIKGNNGEFSGELLADLVIAEVTSVTKGSKQAVAKAVMWEQLMGEYSSLLSAAYSAKFGRLAEMGTGITAKPIVSSRPLRYGVLPSSKNIYDLSRPEQLYQYIQANKPDGFIREGLEARTGMVVKYTIFDYAPSKIEGEQ